MAPGLHNYSDERGRTNGNVTVFQLGAHEKQLQIVKFEVE